jgi:hypothetical protein
MHDCRLTEVYEWGNTTAEKWVAASRASPVSSRQPYTEKTSQYTASNSRFQNIPSIHLSMPACQSALQPWLSLGLLYNQSPPPGVRFLNKIIFYRMGLLAPCPTPILEAQGVSLSLDSTLWPYQHGLALLVVKLPPALLSGSQSRINPTTTTRWRHLWVGIYLHIYNNIGAVGGGDSYSVPRSYKGGTRKNA